MRSPLVVLDRPAYCCSRRLIVVTQVDEELATYTESEMMVVGYEGGSEAAQSSARNVSEVVCVSEHRSRQKRCPGHKRRIVTVTQWDASARRQMIKQLGQRGVT